MSFMVASRMVAFRFRILRELKDAKGKGLFASFGQAIKAVYLGTW